MPGMADYWSTPRRSAPRPTTSGGGGYTASSQAPLTISAQRDPNIDRYMGLFDQRAAQYDALRGELAAGTDRDAVNAMMRQRDLTSGMAKEAFEDRALSTGGVTGLASRARSQALTAGSANASRTNAAMAETGRQQQLQALAGATGAVQSGAGVAIAGNQALQGQQGFALNTWQASQAAADAARRAEEQRRQQDWQNLMQMQQMGVTG